ncbi:MAG: hypothetical protein PHX79_08705 [Sphaerochaetaceae bacterium]|nr:hypothetical protein [Sphaerochaetaceae bacterium]
MTILKAMANDNGYRFCRWAIFACVPLFPLPQECILKRSKTGTTQHLAITFSQGWMAILLNLSWTGDTVLICIGEEEVIESD